MGADLILPSLRAELAMREPDLSVADIPSALPEAPPPRSIALVGAGRMGRALSVALRSAGCEVIGPVGRGEAPRADAILLCVPDAEIRSAASAVAGAASLVGHTSGATPLAALAPAAKAGADAFALHPLQTVNGRGATFEGCGCAIAGSSPEALSFARELAETLGMESFVLPDSARPAYHAAASIASNFLVTIEAAAGSMAEAAGIDPRAARQLLAPLVETTVRNWIEAGEAALTGPLARGDEATVAAQRGAVASARPELLPMFDALVEGTRALASSIRGSAQGAPA